MGPPKATFHSLPAVFLSGLAPLDTPEVRKGREHGHYKSMRYARTNQAVGLQHWLGDRNDPESVLVSSDRILLQGFDQRTADLSRRRATTLDKFCECPLDPTKVGKLDPHIRKLSFCLLARLVAMRPVLELEQFRDLIQAETQPLSRLHETHPGDIRRAVAALP